MALGLIELVLQVAVCRKAMNSKRFSYLSLFLNTKASLKFIAHMRFH